MAMAYDITGKNIASEQSFRSALYTAIDIYNNRNFQQELEEGKLNVDELENIKELKQNGE